MRCEIITFFLGITLLILFMSSCKQESDTSIDQIKMLPDIVLEQYEASIYDLSKQPSVDKTVVLFFSPDCEFCEEEIDSICNHASEFDNIRWILITDSFFEDMLKPFVRNHNLIKLEESVILIEKRHYYTELFQAFKTPSIFVYNSKNKLIHYSRAYVGIDCLMDWLTK